VPPWSPATWRRVGPRYYGKVRAVRQPQGQVTDTLTTPSGTYPGDYAYCGGVLLPDGRVFCVPQAATSARIYDPVTDTLTTPSGTYPGDYAYCGGVLLPDGRVFCVPFYATTARIYGLPDYALPPARVLSAYDNKV
jgi:hypothetical protein